VNWKSLGLWNIPLTVPKSMQKIIWNVKTEFFVFYCILSDTFLGDLAILEMSYYPCLKIKNHNDIKNY